MVDCNMDPALNAGAIAEPVKRNGDYVAHDEPEVKPVEQAAEVKPAEPVKPVEPPPARVEPPQGLRVTNTPTRAPTPPQRGGRR